MPIYEYKCKECDQQFEVFTFSHESMPVPCVKCGSIRTEREISKFAPTGNSPEGSSCGHFGGFS